MKEDQKIWLVEILRPNKKKETNRFGAAVYIDGELTIVCPDGTTLAGMVQNDIEQIANVQMPKAKFNSLSEVEEKYKKGWFDPLFELLVE